jgi:hypothetical protein
MFVIRGGRITHVRLGDLTVSCELSMQTPGGNAELIKKDLKTWSLPGTVPLRATLYAGHTPLAVCIR